MSLNFTKAALPSQGRSLPVPFKTLVERFLVFVGFLGIFICESLACLFAGRLDKREFWSNSHEAAYRSIPTIIITTASIGMVSSLQLTKHFIAFGAGAEIGGSTALAQVRELAPVITAIVLVGRVGSAWAAEIGSMKMTEQISALNVMKINLIDFLISPRIIACMLAMPVLNMVAIFASVLGGFFVAHSIADISIFSFLDSIKRYIEIYDLVVSMLKALCFGAVIAAITCLYGLKAEGGALGVGRYTTKAVVASLVSLFFLNYLLSLFFYSVLK